MLEDKIIMTLAKIYYYCFLHHHLQAVIFHFCHDERTILPSVIIRIADPAYYRDLLVVTNL